MPENVPLFSPEETRESQATTLHYMRAMESLLLAKLKTYDDIGCKSKDLESITKRRIAQETHFTNTILTSQRDLQKEAAEAAFVTAGVEQREFGIVQKGGHERILMYEKYLELVEKGRNLEKEIAERKFKEDTKWGTFSSKVLKDIFGLKVKEYDMTKSITEELQKYPYNLGAWAGILGVIITYLSGAYELFKKFDTAAWNFRKAMAFTRDDAVGFRKTAEGLAIEFAHVGVTIDSAYKSQLALGKEMGSIYSVSNDLVKTTAILSAQLGVSEEATAGFLHNMAAISKSTMQAQQDMVYIASNLASAAGVPLDAVMKDVSNRTDKTLTMMSRIPNVVLRTAIEARRLNTTMNEMARASRSILDFQENVNAEMDASVLSGRSVNMQRARELAYRRDLEGSTKEIIRLTKQMNFENLDVFQQEAFARATGHSVDELLRMVTAERQWEKARRDPTLKGKVEAYEKLRKANAAILKDSSMQRKLMVEQKNNQERIVAIQLKWQQIMMKIQGPLLFVIDKLLEFVANHLEAVLAIGGIFTMWKYGAKIITNISTILENIRLKMLSIGSSTARLSGFLGGLAKFAMRWLLPITFAWNIFKGIKNILNDKTLMGTEGFFAFNGKLILRALGAIGKALWNTINDLAFGLPGALLSGLGSVIESIFGTLVSPFKKAWVWLSETFLGSSPSKLGLSIVKGITSIGSILYDAITSPFRNAFRWVTENIPLVGKLIKGLWGGSSPSQIGLSILNGITSIGSILYDAITSPFRNAFRWVTENIPLVGKLIGKLGGSSVETKAMNTYVPAVTVSPKGTQLNPTAKETPDTLAKENNGEELLSTMKDLLNEVKTLNKNLLDGKIKSPVFLDSQELSCQIDRQTSFRRGFGVNTV